MKRWTADTIPPVSLPAIGAPAPWVRHAVSVAPPLGLPASWRPDGPGRSSAVKVLVLDCHNTRTVIPAVLKRESTDFAGIRFRGYDNVRALTFAIKY